MVLLMNSEAQSVHELVASPAESARYDSSSLLKISEIPSLILSRQVV